MRIAYDQKAVNDLRSIHDWIAASSQAAARRVNDKLVSAINSLQDFSERGVPGDTPTERRLIVPGLPYIVVYDVRKENDTVVVRAIFHGAQDR